MCAVYQARATWASLRARSREMAASAAPCSGDALAGRATARVPSLVAGAAAWRQHTWRSVGAMGVTRGTCPLHPSTWLVQLSGLRRLSPRTSKAHTLMSLVLHVPTPLTSASMTPQASSSSPPARRTNSGKECYTSPYASPPMHSPLRRSADPPHSQTTGARAGMAHACLSPHPPRSRSLSRREGGGVAWRRGAPHGDPPGDENGGGLRDRRGDRGCRRRSRGGGRGTDKVARAR